MSIREKALEWWRELSIAKKGLYASKYFPDFPFFAVTMSSSMVERIFLKERFR